MKAKLGRSVGLFAAAVLVVAACGDDDEASSGPEATASGDTDVAATGHTGASDASVPSDTGGGTQGECPASSAGSELTVGVRSEPTGLDAYVSGSQGSQGGSERQALYDTLMKYDPETGEFEPLIAESLESNADATEWTLTLRDDATFGNGDPVDTAAVQFTVNRHRAEDSTSLHKAEASMIESMEIVDDQTMVFTLSVPWGNFPSMLSGPVGMIADPETFEELGADAFASDPQGGVAGPYRLERWSTGEEMVLTARDDYWGGPVCVETITFSYGLDDDGRLQAFEQGEYDIAFLRKPEAIAQAEAAGAGMYTNVSNAGFTIYINHESPSAPALGTDVRIRQAIAHAIDSDFINERAFGGEGIPGTALVPEESLMYSDAIEGPEYDPERARSLLEEAKADGYDGTLTYLCNQAYEEAAIAMTALLEDVGFTVELVSSIPLGEWSDRILRRDYEAACGSALGTDAQPWASFSQLYSGGGGGLTNYQSNAMQQAMGDLREAQTVEERADAFVGVQQVWNEEIPGAVYGHAAEVFIWRDGVEGLAFSNDLRMVLSGARVTG